MDRAKYICGICEKAYTRNARLRRHRQNVHFNNSYNCLTCPKKFKRQEDLGKHAKVSLNEKLEAEEPKNQPFSHLNQPNRQQDSLDVVRGDLEISDSEDESDPVIDIMTQHLNSQLLGHHTRNMETNTDSVRVHTCDKATNTEPLIVISPDELIKFQDGLTIATFKESLKIFVETLNSKIVMSKPNLECPPEPTLQIGLLKVQPTSSKANQFPVPRMKTVIPDRTEIILSDSDSDDQEQPTTSAANHHQMSPRDKPSAHTDEIVLSDSDSDSENQELIKMCSRKPTRPTMFVPKDKRDELKAKILDFPSCSRTKSN